MPSTSKEQIDTMDARAAMGQQHPSQPPKRKITEWADEDKEIS